MTWIASSSGDGRLGQELEPDPGRVPLLIGPTGVGKSGLALRAAMRCAGEIISMDSCAVYVGLDIGSAKPSAADRGRVRHHLIDCCEPGERYSAGRFFADACRLVREIRSRGRLPIIAGGTMLYANVLLNGIASVPPISDAVRSRARGIVSADPLKARDELARADPAARRLHPKDRVRLERGWEVLLGTGRPLGEWHAAGNKLPDFEIDLHAVLPADRGRMRQALDARFDAMMEAGFAGEVRSLVERHGPHVHALRSVGYRQMVPHALGELGEGEAVAAAKRATRRLARQQLSWIRRFNPPRERTVSV